MLAEIPSAATRGGQRNCGTLAMLHEEVEDRIT
jgi:hypothetical protein